MFDSGTLKMGPRAMAAGAAAIASMALLAAATPAAAAHTIYVKSATMNTTFQANIGGFGAAYSNGVTFTVADSAAANAPTYDLYGFCIDIFHDMYINTPLNYAYTSTYGDYSAQPLYTNYGPNPALNQLDSIQIDKLTNLIDTGWLLHMQDPSGFDTAMRTAAIQAAVWKVANPTVAISVRSNNLTAAQFTQYQTYYNDYLNGNYTSLADLNDRVYTITDQSTNPMHQTFAVGWPIEGVPEPGTWALMIGGFGAVGAMVRRRRLQAA